MICHLLDIPMQPSSRLQNQTIHQELQELSLKFFQSLEILSQSHQFLACERLFFSFQKVFLIRQCFRLLSSLQFFHHTILEEEFPNISALKLANHLYLPAMPSFLASSNLESKHFFHFLL